MPVRVVRDERLTTGGVLAPNDPVVTAGRPDVILDEFSAALAFLKQDLG
jgi:hypothetical protein